MKVRTEKDKVIYNNYKLFMLSIHFFNSSMKKRRERSYQYSPKYYVTGLKGIFVFVIRPGYGASRAKLLRYYVFSLKSKVLVFLLSGSSDFLGSL